MPRNTVQKTVHSSIYQAVSYQLYTEAIFWRSRRKMVSMKEVIVPLPKNASHRLVKSTTSKPAFGVSSRKRNTLTEYPTPSGSSD